MPLTRLDKLVSNSGSVSRSQAQEMIKQGRVTVNGSVVRRPETKIEQESSLVAVDGAAISSSKYVYLMMNKPEGVLSATEDKSQKTVIDLLPETMQRRGLFPVGRLDKDTTGLLLLTNDGEFAHSVISPRKHVIKRYLAHTQGTVDNDDVKLFESGVVLADGTKCLPAGLEAVSGGVCIVTVEEGKYHQVKRMLAACGKPVVKLHRLSIGGLELDSCLKPSDYRELTQKEKAIIFTKWE